METIEQLLSRHAFFTGLRPEQIRLVAGCGRNVQFKPGAMLFRAGDPADEFFVIRDGSVRVEIHSPRLGPIAIQTAHPGEILGWSWLLPPYRWHVDGLAVEAVRATAMDGRCLRGKFASDPALGYAVMQRLAGILSQHLQSTRLQLIEAVEAVSEKPAA